MGNRHWPADPPWPPHDETAGQERGDQGRHSYGRQDDRYGWEHHQYGGRPGSSGYGDRGGVDPRYDHPHAADQWYHPGRSDEHHGWGHSSGYPPGAYPVDPGEVVPAARGPGRQPPSRPEPPGADGDPSWLPTLTWTIGCFVIPIALYLLWAATRSGTPTPDCLDDSGAPCPAPRTEALGGLVEMAPGLIGAVTLALLAAVGLRLMIDTWRPGAVGIAAAVVGAGGATLIATAFG